MRVRTLEILILAIVYLGALWLWTLPFQENTLPYGEGDATSHFVVADTQSQTDKPITTLPYYIDVRYGWDNKFRMHTLWYHPPYHMNFALLQILGGHRFLPVFFFNAILCTSMLFTVYFLVRRLFGFMPAILSAILLIFSGRDYMVYLWGQWPERISYALIPLILYCYFIYTESILENKQKPRYLYVLAFLLGVNFYVHPVGLFHTIAAIGLYSVVLLIKERRLMFKWKHAGIAVFIFLVMAAMFPLQTASVGIATVKEKAFEGNFMNLGRLFEWYPDAEQFVGGVPVTYFSYAFNNGTWTIPFLLVGILALALRRKRKDWLMLTWLISFYVMTHLDVIGKGRVHRSMAAEAHILYPLIAIGFTWLVSLIRLKRPLRTYLKVGASIAFIIVAIMINGKVAYSNLHNAYGGISRLTEPQLNVALWLKDNLGEFDKIEDFGTLTISKKRFIQYIGNRHIIKSNFKDDFDIPTHVMLDYSDLAVLQQIPEYRQQIEGMLQIEAQLENMTLQYDKENIKVYKLEAS
ncbi:MAG: glycosyltransferase family 39 protein [Nanoarchaeota archaeon]|nr:glycosyltransferase family 39 protein [Nanoarchaeota archaeon]